MAAPGENAPAPSSTTEVAGGGAPVALDWEVVRPAGSGSPDRHSALSLEDSETDDTGEERESRQLEVGTMRSTLQTGPENPLILPPEIASVVYVVDCSGSMAGGKFDRVTTSISDAVGRMKPDQQFAVLLFHTSALQIRGGGYLHATKQNVQSLRAAFTNISPSGGTNPTDALLLAIQLKAETVVVISDGEFEPWVVHHATKLNRTSGLNSRINCVAIGSRVETLRLLASLNGPGSYVETR